MWYTERNTIAWYFEYRESTAVYLYVAVFGKLKKRYVEARDCSEYFVIVICTFWWAFLLHITFNLLLSPCCLIVTCFRLLAANFNINFHGNSNKRNTLKCRLPYVCHFVGASMYYGPSRPFGPSAGEQDDTLESCPKLHLITLTGSLSLVKYAQLGIKLLGTNWAPLCFYNRTLDTKW